MPDEHAMSERTRWIALYVLCMGMLMIVLDATVVNVALPSIQNDLGFTNSGLAWVVNAYLIAFGGLLLLAGRLGDLLGRKNIFMAGLFLFTLASITCGFASGQTMLVLARFMQGIGGAMTSSVILGMIVTMFPAPSEQAKAIGVYGFVASTGGSVGLLAGGVLTQSINWHWIFFVNVPIGLATATLAWRLLERDVGIGLREGADVPGAALITSSLMLGVYTIVKPAADLGWGASKTVLLGLLAVGLFVGFVAREATAERPLMPLHIFRSRNVSGANAIQALFVAGMFGMFFLGALYLQKVLHYSPLGIGLAFLPVTAVSGVLSLRYAEALVMRFGPRRTLVPGLSSIALGLALFSQASAHGTYISAVLAPMTLLGAGAGLCFPSLMVLAMSGATNNDAGLASGLVNTTLQVGGALGLAVLATLAATRTKHLLASHASSAASLTGGYQLAFMIGAGLSVAAIGVALTVLEPPPMHTLAHAHAPVPEAEPAYAEV